MWLSNAQNRWLLSINFVSFVSVSMISCTSLNRSTSERDVQPVTFASNTATIAAINQPSSINTIVQVKGKVGNRAPLLGKTAYELQDATGRIWVLASDSIPNAGDEVIVKGKLLYQSIRLNGKEQGTSYIEQQQLSTQQK